MIFNKTYQHFYLVSMQAKKALFNSTAKKPTEKKPVRKVYADGFDPESYLKPGLSVERIESLKEGYDFYADKETGFIDAAEVRELLEELGQDAHEGQLHYTLQVVLNSFGPQEEGAQINFEQFLYLMTEHVTDQDSREDMGRLFNLYDDDRVGFLTKEKLRHIADEYGIWVSDEELEAMISTASLAKDQKVTEEDFYLLLTSKHNAVQ